MLHLLTSGRPPEPLPSSIHPAIARVVQMALSNPSHLRVQSAADLHDAIEAAMVEARCPATPADVAAFVGEHLADRIAKRRKVIDIAIAAATERERVEEALRPAVDRATGLSSLHPGEGDRTVADGGAMRSPLPTPWPMPLSGPVTLPQAMASDVYPAQRSRQPAIVAAVFFATLAMAAAFLFTSVRARIKAATPPSAAAAPMPQEPQAVDPAPVAAGESAEPEGAEPAGAAPLEPPVPGTPAGALPPLPTPGGSPLRPPAPWRPVPAPAPAPVPAPVPAPAPATDPAPAAPEPVPPPKKRNVDDGF